MEKSNHDHLGKLLTYLVSVEAKAAIWIVSEPRSPHLKAIAWLNESSSASFYLLKLEAVKIGDSLPAPLLTLVVGPSEEAKEAGGRKIERAERYAIRHRFWTELLDKAARKTDLHANLTPPQGGFMDTSAGRRGLRFSYVIRKHDADVELYIDRGTEAGDENRNIFDQLLASRGQVEYSFGERLDWQTLEGKRAFRIKKQITVGGVSGRTQVAKTAGEHD